MTHKYLKNVVTLSFNAERCIGCEKCTEVCPHGVFAMTQEISQIMDIDKCIECGACVLNCPTEAIHVSAGVGCANAIIKSWFTGKEPTCGCSDSGCC